MYIATAIQGIELLNKKWIVYGSGLIKAEDLFKSSKTSSLHGPVKHKQQNVSCYFLTKKHMH